MILGRTTVQILGLVGIVLGLIVAGFPGIGEDLTRIFAFAIAADAALITWLTATATTPTSDPRLVAGTEVTVLTPAGVIAGRHTIPAPRA
jgi:hypothetical protein